MFRFAQLSKKPTVALKNSTKKDKNPAHEGTWQNKRV